MASPNPLGNICIRAVTPADAESWLELRAQLGPNWVGEGTERDLEEYFERGTIAQVPHTVLLAEDAAGKAVGLAEVSLRQFAEGCATSPVGYLEGWVVDESARGRGVGRQLVEAAIQWARSKGCTEFASDAELENHVSLLAHEHLGFEPVCDVRCFRLPLT